MRKRECEKENEEVESKRQKKNGKVGTSELDEI